MIRIGWKQGRARQPTEWITYHTNGWSAGHQVDGRTGHHPDEGAHTNVRRTSGLTATTAAASSPEIDIPLLLFGQAPGPLGNRRIHTAARLWQRDTILSTGGCRRSPRFISSAGGLPSCRLNEVVRLVPAFLRALVENGDTTQSQADEYLERWEAMPGQVDSGLEDWLAARPAMGDVDPGPMGMPGVAPNA